MDVDRLEACSVEGRGHLDLPVHALLPQDGHSAPLRSLRGRSPGVERQLRPTAGVVRVEAERLLLARARRIVAEVLHREGRLRPRRAQLHERDVQQLLHDEPVASGRPEEARVLRHAP